ncbi:hypothetical protein PAMC26510_19345 [Caballeronia sordidicola]|uniref:Uncharacterized protein n=1 Tax=Caballeronia sordidicola TaxID=196367 RepID=A0A242MR10_CABSO|nr:hypothetical protein PAMC26510_19345 [Caballeronia sordidicola]
MRGTAVIDELAGLKDGAAPSAFLSILVCMVKGWGGLALHSLST